MNGLVCVRGRLLSPTQLLTDDGEITIAKDNFYEVGQIYVFLINTREYPWRIWKAIKLRC